MYGQFIKATEGYEMNTLMGKDEKLFDAIKWITPCDQTKHPTEKTWTPPYAIVNCYQQIPGLDHRGLMCFLTGSVAMAMRGVYEWMAGIRPVLDGIEIEPCIPKDMQTMEAEFTYLDKKHTLRIEGDKAYLDGKELTTKRQNMITGHDVWFVAEADIDYFYFRRAANQILDASKQKGCRH